MTSFKHLENAKSRARLLEKSPDDSHNQFKRFARPYTAPEVMPPKCLSCVQSCDVQMSL